MNTDTLLLHLKLRHPAEWKKESGFKPWPERICRIYLRVSSADQSADIQRATLRTYLSLKGVPESNQIWYEEDGDGETGTTMERPGIMRLMGDLKAGDVFILTHPDRLARKSSDFMALTHAIKAKKADIYATDFPIDTTDPGGRFLWQLMGLFAEFEWFRIVSRTMAGAEASRASGVISGRHRAGCGTNFPCPTNIHSPGMPRLGKPRPTQAGLSPENPPAPSGA